MNRRDVLKTAPVAVVAAGLPAVAASADAELLRLGALFEAAWEHERALAKIDVPEGEYDPMEDAIDQTSLIVGQIEQLPATTLEGFKVKARCVQWCFCSDPVDLGEHDTTEYRLANQLINELLAIRA